MAIGFERRRGGQAAPVPPIGDEQDAILRRRRTCFRCGRRVERYADLAGTP